MSLDYDTPADIRRNELALEGWGISFYATITNSQIKRFIDRIIQNEASVEAARALAAKWHKSYQDYAGGEDFSVIDANDDAAHELDNALNGPAA
jgi:uncharacterized protein YhdP